MTRYLFALAALGLATACQPEEEPELSDGKLTQVEAEECDFRGGEIITGGLLGHQVCQLPTDDAGQSCRSGSDCEGLCLAESASCAPVTPMFGCHDILVGDGEFAGICID